MTVSAWWVVWAFLGGGCAGILLMALMFVASSGGGTDSLLDRSAGDHADPLHGAT